jgi:hypothetical protein
MILEPLTTPTKKTLEPVVWTIKYLIKPSVSIKLLKLKRGMKPSKDISNLNHTVNQFELLKTRKTETVITLVNKKKEGFNFVTETVLSKNFLVRNQVYYIYTTISV